LVEDQGALIVGVGQEDDRAVGGDRVLRVDDADGVGPAVLSGKLIARRNLVRPRVESYDRQWRFFDDYHERPLLTGEDAE
jgi:hypothetical protein